MFKWRWSADPIYLHCEVDICNKTIEQCLGDAVSITIFVYKILTLDKQSTYTLS